jgi:hypothetical protein
MSVAHAPSTSRRTAGSVLAHTSCSALSRATTGTLVGLGFLLGAVRPPKPLWRSGAAVQGRRHRSTELEQPTSRQPNLSPIAERCGAWLRPVGPLQRQAQRAPVRALDVYVAGASELACHGNHPELSADQRVDRQGDLHPFRRKGPACGSLCTSSSTLSACSMRSSAGSKPASAAAWWRCDAATSRGGC